MSNHSLMVFFTILIAWFVIRHFYRNTVHPFLMDRARFRIFEIRDELRKVQMSRKFSKPELRAISFMENALNGSVNFCENIRLGDFWADTRFSAAQPDEASKRFEEFRKHAPEELDRLDKKFARTAWSMMLANSPLLVILMLLWFAPIFWVQEMLGKASGWKKMRQGFANFVHAAPCHNG